MIKQISIKAPAKINLALDIRDRRCDGYHNVRMIMQSVSCYDIVTVCLNDSKSISISCNNPAVPTDERNLVYKAAKEFFRIYGKNSGVHINIEKNIPMNAGLAGGSTDCAAVLYGLNKLFDNPLEKEKLLTIGGSIGKDVPFCFDGGTSLAQGTGDEISSLSPLAPCFILLVKPELDISTKKAYEMADSRDTAKQKDHCEDMIKALERRDIKAVSACLYNDFEEVLKLKVIGEIKEQLMDLGARGACMSGSGPTLYGIFLNEEKANTALIEMKRKYQQVHLCTPINFGCVLK